VIVVEVLQGGNFHLYQGVFSLFMCHPGANFYLEMFLTRFYFLVKIYADF